MVEQAGTLVQSPNVRFAVGDGASLSLVPDASVDYVVTFTVFQHMPSVQLIDAYIADVARVLAPGGVFAFQWNNLPNARAWRAKRAVASTLQRTGLRRERYGRNAAEFMGSRVPVDHVTAVVKAAGLEPHGTRDLGSLFAWMWARRPA
jgi:SAM-dependent methyltransferase